MIPSVSTALPPKWHSRPFGRLAIGGLLLLVEYLALSYAFDAKSVAERGGIWTVLGMAGNVGPLLVVGATAFLLVPQLLGTADSTTVALKRPSVWLLVLHALLAAAFAFVTSLAFGGKQAPPGPALLWMLVWSVFGAATAASLLIGVLGDWRWLSRTLGRVVVAGSALGLVAWIGGSLSTELWEPLSRATFSVVAGILGLLGFDLQIDAPHVLLYLEGFAVTIAPVCSGFEGIGLFAVLMAGFLYQLRARLRFPRALILLPLGMAIVWLGNAVRIAALMIVGARVDPMIALGSFHSKAGWVLFSGITLGIAVVARNSAFFARREASETSTALENPAVPLLVPVLTWIGIGLVTSTFSAHHDPLYGLRVFIASGVLWAYRARLWQWVQRPTPAAWALGLLVGVAWLAIPLGVATDDASRTPPGADWARGWFTTWMVLRCVGAIIVVPICEELAFRGYLARWLTRRDFWEVPFKDLSWIGILGSSVVFGAVHGRWVLGTVTGILFAWLVRRSGRLVDSIVAHAVSNAVIAVWVLTTGDWRHW